MLVYEFMAAGDLTKALARDQNEPRRCDLALSGLCCAARVLRLCRMPWLALFVPQHRASCMHCIKRGFIQCRPFCCFHSFLTFPGRLGVCGTLMVSLSIPTMSRCGGCLTLTVFECQASCVRQAGLAWHRVEDPVGRRARAGILAQPEGAQQASTAGQAGSACTACCEPHGAPCSAGCKQKSTLSRVWCPAEVLRMQCIRMSTHACTLLRGRARR